MKTLTALLFYLLLPSLANASLGSHPPPPEPSPPGDNPEIPGYGDPEFRSTETDEPQLDVHSGGVFSSPIELRLMGVLARYLFRSSTIDEVSMSYDIMKDEENLELKFDWVICIIRPDGKVFLTTAEYRQIDPVQFALELAEIKRLKGFLRHSDDEGVIEFLQTNPEIVRSLEPESSEY